QHKDLAAVVTASGEIKPKNYVNIGANAFGKIVKLYVKEGERVKKGQLLAQIENVQSAADVAATQASLGAAQTDFVAAEAAFKTSVADLNRAKLDYDRAVSLFQAQLIPKSEFDMRKATWEMADASVAQTEARIAQAKA